MPTSSYKDDIPSTSIKGSKTSYFETYDHTRVIEKFQQENAQFLQQLEEGKTMDRNLHHDNVVLQEKVNYLQRLVDQMTTTNQSLQMKLKHCKRPKKKSPDKEGEASKATPPPPSRV